MTEMIATRQAYGDTLVELGEKNKDIVVLDADLSKSTTTAKFGKKFPDRFFNMGVAEANMMCYSGVNVKIVATHSGVSVGPDGASHQCIEDISLMKTIPTMTVVEPCDAVETRKAILAAVAHKGPIYIRLGRAAVPVITKKEDLYTIGKASILRSGKDVAIVACGALVANSLTAADILSREGIEATVVNMHTIKPVDHETLVKVAKQVNAIVTAEQHVLDGGLGSAVASVLARNYPVPMEMIGIDNRFGQSGEPDILFKEYHLLPEDIVVAAKEAIERKKK